MNKNLDKAKKVLANTYFVEEKDENIISLSPSNESLPFAYLLYDDDYPNTIILSFAVDYPDATASADLVLTLIHICKVAVGEPFFCDNGFNMHWGEDAYQKFELQELVDLGTLEPISDLRN